MDSEVARALEEANRIDVPRDAPYNPRRISREALDALKVSLREFGDVSGITFNRRTGNLIAGHQRRKILTRDFDPSDIQWLDGREGDERWGFIETSVGARFSVREVDWTEEKEKAANVAANSPLLTGEFDDDGLSALLSELKDSGDLAFTELRLDELLDDLDDDFVYTAKVESPVYEPTGDEPDLEDLCNTDKTDRLLASIEEAEGVPEEVKAFLRCAAQRHLAFRYDRIAEYYAHAPAEIQRLFEASALVVIDFNRAIEDGFVRLTEDMQRAIDSST